MFGLGGEGSPTEGSGDAAARPHCGRVDRRFIFIGRVGRHGCRELASRLQRYLKQLKQ